MFSTWRSTSPVERSFTALIASPPPPPPAPSRGGNHVSPTSPLLLPPSPRLRRGSHQVERPGAPPPPPRNDASLRRRLPEVGLDHALVLLDLLRRTLGDLLAVVEHGHAVGDAHHDLHVVLDQQDRDVPLLA